MAQRVQVTLVCDLHGDETPAGETVTFGLDGSTYQIDLCGEHASQLRESFAGYVGVARRASGRSGTAPSGGRRRRTRGSGEAAAIREWARERGLAVPERGRIPADLAAKYTAERG
ncbi:MAG: hypothetical protein QOD07_252 [Frankiaceae bacterium]|jgi:hypothetical protein|nr:hypothetical protein [Frankiaceae bacterium]